MAYRAFPCFVTRSAKREARVDPYATERRSLPNRTHGISYASSPRRSARIRTYTPSEAVRPASASAQSAPPEAVDLKRVLAAVRRAHPYEEPVINVIPLWKTGL